MPDKETLDRAKEDEREGKSPSTQAGEFVREEIHHVREGKHGARSTKQAIAIGLSKARRAGVKLGVPKKGKASAEVRHKAQRDIAKGRRTQGGKPSRKRSRAATGALKRESHSSVSSTKLARQAHTAALTRGPRAREEAARKAVRSKGETGLKRAARKAARTRTISRAA